MIAYNANYLAIYPFTHFSIFPFFSSKGTCEILSYSDVSRYRVVCVEKQRVGFMKDVCLLRQVRRVRLELGFSYKS